MPDGIMDGGCEKENYNPEVKVGLEDSYRFEFSRGRSAVGTCSLV